MTKHGVPPSDWDPETGLRATLAAGVADVRVPADLLARAAARNRQRALRNRLTGAAGAAAVTAIAVTTIVSGPVQSAARKAAAPSTAPARAQTADYIVRHAAAAEIAARRMIQVTRSPAGAYYMSVATQQTAFISSRRTSHGQPLMADGESIKGTTYKHTSIDYKDRVYNVLSASTLKGGPWGAKGIVIGSWLPGVTASDPASAYTAALRSGMIKVIGRRQVHGRQTILIQIHQLPYRHICGDQNRTCPTPPPGPPRPSTCKMPPPAVSEVWLDTSTYLEAQKGTLTPRTVMHMDWLNKRRHVGLACYKVTGWSESTTSVGWLPPTKHNLALLNMTPPAGFTRVSNQQMDRYLGPYS